MLRFMWQLPRLSSHGMALLKVDVLTESVNITEFNKAMAAQYVNAGNAATHRR